jgi:hypothetical protein
MTGFDAFHIKGKTVNHDVTTEIGPLLTRAHAPTNLRQETFLRTPGFLRIEPTTRSVVQTLKSLPFL